MAIKPPCRPSARDVRRAAFQAVIANAVSLLVLITAINLPAEVLAQINLLTNSLLTLGMLLTSEPQ